MRKITLALLAAALMLFSPGVALADHVDGCDHGASNKECREDPQPDKGKDCEQHGKPGVGGGENEDHCKKITEPPRRCLACQPVKQRRPGGSPEREDDVPEKLAETALPGAQGLSLLGLGLVTIGGIIRKRAGASLR